MKGFLDVDMRKLFKDLDELYYEQPKPEVKKLNDDLMFALRTALNERFKLFRGDFEKAKRELEETYKKVESEYKKHVASGVSGLKKRLESAIDILESKINIVRRKAEELRGRRLSLEAKVKPLLKEGRIEEAEIWIPEITELENGENLCMRFIRAVGKIVSRIKGTLIRIDVLETLKGIQITKMDFEEIRKLKDDAENTLKDLDKLQDDLNDVLSMTSTGILSGTLTEDEMRTLKRLIEETGEVAENVREYIKELEEAEDKLRELKS